MRSTSVAGARRHEPHEGSVAACITCSCSCSPGTCSGTSSRKPTGRPRTRSRAGRPIWRTSSYHLILASLVLPVWHDWRVAWFLAISVGTHALVDRRWPTRLLLGSTGSKNFSTVMWGVIATDQALHLSILAVSVYWLSR
jgi:hypothetical protein